MSRIYRLHVCVWAIFQFTQQNIPEPNVDDMKKQLDEDWQAWLDNPNLRTKWLAECKAREEESEQNKAEQANDDYGMDIYLASSQQHVQATDYSVIAEDIVIEDVDADRT